MNEPLPRMPWHALAIDDLIERLRTSRSGLAGDEAGKRLEASGPNTLEAQEGTHPLLMFARQFNDPLIFLLAGAAVLSLLAGHAIDAGVIAGVIVLNSVMGFVQEWRAEGALEALRALAAPHARVLRGGDRMEIAAAQVVTGDILLLETGDRIAADARLLTSENLRVDESALTGESEPAEKNAATMDEKVQVADCQNMVWMSTNITGGRGRAVVVATGMETEVGRIAGEVRATQRESTPLQKRMHKLSLYLGLGSVVLAAFVFALGIARGHGLIQMLLFSVAAAVSAIPEGLPAVISVTLALGVRRMAQRHAIIRRMPAVETLGSTTVICSDKTGTITKNQMTVRRLWAGARTFETSGEGYEPAGRITGQGGTAITQLPSALERLLTIGVLCNNANLKQDAQWRVEGNPSEGSLLAVALKAGMNIETIRTSAPRVAEMPFSSDVKYMATLHPAGDGTGRTAYVKGAPEKIMAFCSHIMIDDEPVAFTEELRHEVARVNEAFASSALRVIAGAYREFGKETAGLARQEIEHGLTFAGLWGMIDPPREESIEAVRDAKRAGIQPVMITGDHAVTALAIARQVGIAEDGKALAGPDIDNMDRPALARAALDTGVFARVTPGHKRKIMEALKEQGHVVAMTGDGVNDAPALKGADIGVAMGRAGTEVAKEAADMVLTDDNFATIVHAIEEGRVIYANLRRVIFFLLATNLGEILTLVAALLIGLDLPLTAVMILWINLVTDGACTIPIGVEPKHADVLTFPPRNPREPILDRSLLLRMALLTPIMAAGTLLLFWNAQRHGDMAYARTVGFTAMAVFQWFQAFNARSNYNSVFSIGVFSNRALLLGVGSAALLQIGVVETALGQRLFGTTGLSFMDWIVILVAASSIWIADEILKLLRARGVKSRHWT